MISFLLNPPNKVSHRLMAAFILVGAALGLTLILRRLLDVPYWFPFLVAGIASAWIGGRVSGWTAVILSTLACDYFFDPPYYSLAVDTDQLPNFIAFTIAMLAGNWFGAWRKRADMQSKQTRDELASRVQAGGVELEKISEALRSEVHQRERAEQGRRVAELRWRAVFDNAVIGVALADERGHIMSSNEPYLRLLDVCRSDLLGSRLDEYAAESSRAEFKTRLAELLGGRRKHLEIEIERQVPGRAAAWLRIHIALVAGTAEFPRFFIAFCEDNSERKRTEEALVAARANLAHAARLTTIGELTASIAHELNQPLSAIVTNSNACLRWLGGGSDANLPEAQSTLNWIMRDAKRASDVIARIRALMRKSEARFETLDFSDIVRDGLEMIQGELRRSKVEVAIEIEAQLPRIQGDRIQLLQVFLNLSLNAIDAMANVYAHPRLLTIQAARQAGDVDGILIDIRDSGCGVEEADIDKLFTSFFTTKAEGTGLGLWISRSIVEAHAGQMFASRNSPHGMSFRLLLPCQPWSASAHDILSIAGEDFGADLDAVADVISQGIPEHTRRATR